MALSLTGEAVIPIRFISTHRADAGHVDPLRKAAEKDQRFQVTDNNRGIVFVQGDRTELLGEVMSAVAENAVIAHAAGGERTLGSTDDRVRDAMTKLAHLHYPVHQEAKRRLLLLGEEEWRICVSGEVGVDTIMAMEDVELPDVYRKAKPGDLLVAIHPVTGNEQETLSVIRAAQVHISCFCNLERRVWIAISNGDPGSEVIERQLAYYHSWPEITFVRPSLSHPQFVTLMKRCGTIIGNSSCLITEAPHLGVFTILLGSRQAGRLPAPSDGMACEHILNHMAHSWGNPKLRHKA